MNIRSRVSLRAVLVTLILMLTAFAAAFAIRERLARLNKHRSHAEGIERIGDELKTAQNNIAVLEAEKKQAGRDQAASEQRIQSAERAFREAVAVAKEQQSEIDRIKRQVDRLGDLHNSSDGFDVIEDDGYTLFLPKALRWRLNRDTVQVAIRIARLSASVQLADFKRKVRIRVVSGESLPGVNGMFRDVGDELLIWPDHVNIRTLTHELTHALLFQLFEGKVPLPIDEAIAYTAALTPPQEMLDRLGTLGPVKREALGQPWKEENDRTRVEASAWCVVYYLRVFRGLSLTQIARMKVDDLPDPREVVGAVTAHAMLTEPETHAHSISSPTSSPYFDLAELSPLGPGDLERCNASDPTFHRRLVATRALLQHDAAVRKVELPAPYSAVKNLPTGEQLWNRNRRDVYRLMLQSLDLYCCAFPKGVSVRRLTSATTAPLVTEEEFVKASYGTKLRERCESLAWAHSYHRIFEEGRPSLLLEHRDLTLAAVADLNPKRGAILRSAWATAIDSATSLGFWKHQR